MTRIGGKDAAAWAAARITQEACVMETRSRAPKIKRTKRLTLKDRLSRLTYHRACQLLGPDGPHMIRRGATYQDIDLDRDVYFRGDLFRLKLRGAARGKDPVVTITLMAPARNRLRFNCTACETLCEHVGAAFSLVLEEKTALGLAAEPEERRPLETLSPKELVEQALRDREEAEAMLADASARREAALAEAQALLSGAKDEAARLAAAAEAEAKSTAERRERMAMDRIAAAEKAAVDEVRLTAADIAGVAAGQVIRKELTAADDAALIDRAIGGLAGALGHRAA